MTKNPNQTKLRQIWDAAVKNILPHSTPNYTVAPPIAFGEPDMEMGVYYPTFHLRIRDEDFDIRTGDHTITLPNTGLKSVLIAIQDQLKLETI